LTTAGRCDFCGSPTGPGKRGYKPEAQIALAHPGAVWLDRGEWVACAECGALIEEENWKGLMARAQNLNPAIRTAAAAGKLDGVTRFIADAWSGVFNMPPEVFL
jgi:hypothetical protein